MGETLLAAGISVRSALSSISDAQKEHGHIVVAGAIGRNVFDIWIGLGLPWLLVIPFIGEESSYGRYIEVDNAELLPSVAILFGVLVLYVLSVIYSRWTLDKRHGILFIVLYGIYALYDIIAVWAFHLYQSEESP